MNIDIDLAGFAVSIGAALLVADLTPDYRGPGWIAFGVVGLLWTFGSRLAKRKP